MAAALAAADPPSQADSGTLSQLDRTGALGLSGGSLGTWYLVPLPTRSSRTAGLRTLACVLRCPAKAVARGCVAGAGPGAAATVSGLEAGLGSLAGSPGGSLGEREDPLVESHGGIRWGYPPGPPGGSPRGAWRILPEDPPTCPEWNVCDFRCWLFVSNAHCHSAVNMA